jgi:tetraacyldisaccharide 4'-kinase
MKPAAWAEALLAKHWWQPRRTGLSWMLQPLAWLYGRLVQAHRARSRTGRAPVPVIVVGNLVTGGAGKTPTVIALVQALAGLGKRPGVVSRGYGRRGSSPQAVQADSTPQAVGDEPWVVQRRTGVPVWVGQDRLAACLALCQAHPEIDELVQDDGLQHHALHHDAAVVVFVVGGVGNGCCRPAPCVNRCPVSCRRTGGCCTPRACAARLGREHWPSGTSGLPGHWTPGSRLLPACKALGLPLVGRAALAAPEKFFSMLEGCGLHIDRLPLPDHHAYETLPCPPAPPRSSPPRRTRPSSRLHAWATQASGWCR